MASNPNILDLALNIKTDAHNELTMATAAFFLKGDETVLRLISRLGRGNLEDDVYEAALVVATALAVFDKFSEAVTAEFAKHGMVSTCKMGCSKCCTQPITTEFWESLLAGYYLKTHPEIQQNFLTVFPGWKAHTDKKKNIYARWLSSQNPGVKTLGRVDLKPGAGFSFAEIAYPCPALKDGICTIYPARPWVCRSMISLTPPEECHEPDEDGLFKTIRHLPEENWEPFIQKLLALYQHLSNAFFAGDRPVDLLPIYVHQVLTDDETIVRKIKKMS